jgi:effector-binding domain-containing protein
MANQTLITAMLRLVSSGVKETVKETAQINSNLKAAADQAERLGKTRRPVAATMAPGGTSGSRQASMAPAPGKEVRDYGTQRGAAGLTGASARDFANQAQGLGGIVRLYATYAANVFAVGAAFRALSAAQDTTNMVKGLNQLGAASGTALGNLSKQLVKATDGAVSLREAMEATVKASSSGMSSKDIMRMGEVAKKASQALGVDMSDALSRISRGITKLEPELLDELGIFTRLDPAVKAYAKSVNKAASELTDFERRMAFANAVLEEGEQKFNEINIDSNPYTKLAASLKDLSTTIGSLLNTVLAPLAGFLASSPTALLLGVGALVSMLLKQAIPALGEFKEGLRQASQASSAAAIKKIQDNELSVRAKNLGKVKELLEQEADAKVAAHDRAQALIEKASSKKINKEVGGLITKYEKSPAAEWTEKDLAILDKHAAKRKAFSKTYAELAMSIRESKAAEQAYISVRREHDAAVEQSNKVQSRLTTVGRNQRAASAAAYTALRQETLANISHTASVDGVRAAYSRLIKDIRDMRAQGRGLSMSFAELDANGQATGRTLNQQTGALTAGRTAMLAFSGVASIAATTVQSLGVALASVMGWLGLIAGAIAVIDMVFSKAGKEVRAFEDAAQSLTDTSKTLIDVTERYSKAGFNEAFSNKSVEAYSNSLIGLSDSIESVEKNIVKARQALAASPWDKFKDSIKGVFGSGISDKEKEGYSELAKSLVSTVSKSGPLLDKFKTQISSAFGVKNISNAKELEIAIASIYADPTKREQLVKIIRATGVELGNAASKGKSLDEALDKAVIASKALGDSYRVSNPITNFAEAGITAIKELNATITDPLESKISALERTLEKLKDVPLLGESLKLGVDLSEDLDKYKKELDEFRKLKLEQEKILQSAKDSKAAIVQEPSLSEYSDKYKTRMVSAMEANKKNTPSAAQIDLDKTNSKITEVQSKLSSLYLTATNAAKKGLDAFYSTIEKQITFALTKPVNAFANAVTSALAGKGVTGVAERTAKAAQADVNYETLQITLERDALIELKKIAYNTELANLEKDKEGIEALKGQLDPSIFNKVLAPIVEKIAAAQKGLSAVSTGNAREIFSLGKASNNTELLNLSQKLAGFQSALRAQGDKFAQIQFQKGYDSLAESSKKGQEGNEALKEELKLKEQALSIDEKLAGYASEKIISERESVNLQKLDTEYTSQIAAIRLDTNQIEYLIKTGKLSLTEIAELELKIAENISKEIDLQSSKQKQQAGIRKDSELALLKLSNDRFSAQMGLIEAQQTAKNLETETGFAARESTLAMYERLGLSKEFLLNAQAELELDKLKSEEESKINSLKLKYIQDVTAAQQIADETQKLAKLQALQTVFEAEANSIATLSAMKQGDVSAKLKFDIDTTAIESLKTLFDELGTSLEGLGNKYSEALSGIVSTIGEVTIAQLESAKSIEDTDKAAKKAYDAGRYEEYFDLMDEGDKKRKKAEKDELTGTAKILGASKKLFKEKTVAYKVLNAAEKAAHIAKIAMDMKELYTKLFVEKAKVGAAVAGETAQTGATQAGFFARAGTYVTEIFAKFSAQLGIFGTAAAAAVVLALGLAGGRRSSAPATGEYSTMAEADGRGTTFGDKNARSESLEKAMETLKEADPVMMRTSTGMLKHLRSIDNNIAALGVALVKALPGGGDISTEKFGVSQGMVGKWMGWQNLPLIGGLVSSVLKGLGFGTKTTVKSEGITGGPQTIGEIEDEGFSGNFFTIVEKKRKAFNITFDKSNKRLLDDLDPQIERALASIIISAKNAVLDAANIMGRSAEQINDQLRNYVINLGDINLKGLSLEDQREKFSGIVGRELDLLVESAYPEVLDFIKGSEGAYATLGRLIYGVEEAQSALTVLGIKTIKYSDIIDKQGDIGAELVRQSIVAQETNDFISSVIDSMNGSAQDIADVYSQLDTTRDTMLLLGMSSDMLSQQTVIAAGGIDNLSDSLSNFYDKFTSESKKTQDNNEKVNNLFSRLNITLPRTRKEVLNLVQALSSTDPEAAGIIIAATDALDDYYSALEKFTDSTRDYEIQILNLIGRTREATALERAASLEDIDTNLKATQQYVWALEDLRDAESDLEKARSKQIDTLRKTVSSTKSFMDGLKKLRESLLLDATFSTLTPLQKYETARLKMYETLQVATSTGTSSTEIAARDEARTAFSNTASDFLKLSRDLFASSEQYTSDFNTVQNILSSTELAVQQQLSIEERTLNAIETVNESVLSVEEAIQRLSTATQNVNRAQQSYELERRDNATRPLVDQVVTGFTKLDKNLDGILTVEELKSSGIATDSNLTEMYRMMDTNGDGQISMLEAISAASSGTFYTIQSVEEVMRAMNAGQINITQAESLISKLISANVSSGGAAPTPDPGTAATRVDDWKAGVRYDKSKIPSGFNWKGYITDNADLLKAGIDTQVEAERHYALFGKKEGRNALSTSTGSALDYYTPPKEDWSWMNSSILNFAPSWNWDEGMPWFDVGTNYVPEDMVAMVHKGERIIPAADNTKLMAYLNNTELLEQIKVLNQKIDSLERTVAEGSYQNVVATEKNTQEISRSVKDAGSIASHSEAVRRRTSII